MSQNLQGTFTSEKISKIRWRPQDLNESNFFVTGSWDNDSNCIRLWSYRQSEEESEVYPFEVESFDNFEGDVTELKFLNSELLVVSFSSGSALLLKLIHPSLKLRVSQEWKNLHTFKSGSKCSCIFSLYDEDIVTVGENGMLNLLTAKLDTVIRSVDADSCSIQCVTFLKYNEVLTGNIRGQMKIWDLRSEDNQPATTFMLSNEQIGATCLTYHPTQRHLVFAGDEDGAVTVWDLRQNTFPVTLLSAHSSSVYELQFHPDYPENLFSCSNSGELWHWNASNQGKLAGSYANLTPELNLNPWLSAEGVKNRLEVESLMPKLHQPINSLDVNKNKVLCGCDNEAFYLINDVSLY